MLDDAQCLLVCESCGCVIGSDELISAVAYQNGQATSSLVPEEHDTAPESLRSNPGRVQLRFRSVQAGSGSPEGGTRARSSGSMHRRASVLASACHRACRTLLQSSWSTCHLSWRTPLAAPRRAWQVTARLPRARLPGDCSRAEHSDLLDAGATVYVAAYQAGYPAFLVDIAQHLQIQLHKLLPAVREARKALSLSARGTRSAGIRPCRRLTCWQRRIAAASCQAPCRCLQLVVCCPVSEHL